MKIKTSILFEFVTWMQFGGHGLSEKKKSIVMNRNGKQAIITKSDGDYLEMNEYCAQRYMLFLNQWLKKGKCFIYELGAIGMEVVRGNRQHMKLMELAK